VSSSGSGASRVRMVGLIELGPKWTLTGPWHGLGLVIQLADITQERQHSGLGPGAGAQVSVGQDRDAVLIGQLLHRSGTANWRLGRAMLQEASRVWRSIGSSSVVGVGVLDMIGLR